MFQRIFARFLLIVALVVAGVGLPTMAAQAAGTPDVALSRTVDSDTLYGDSVAVSLKASNGGTTPGYNLSFTDVLPREQPSIPRIWGHPRRRSPSAAAAYVHSSARTVPSFDASGTVEGDSFTGSDTQSSTTELVAFITTKTEPSPRGRAPPRRTRPPERVHHHGDQ